MADVSQCAAEALLMENQESSSDAGDGEMPRSATRDKPVCLIVLGMAGSGKTTFVQVMLACLVNAS